MLVLTVGLGLMAAFFGWLLNYCLRMGVVGGGRGPWAKDAHRDLQPIRYWTGIVGLAIAAAFPIGCLIYIVWMSVT